MIIGIITFFTLIIISLGIARRFAHFYPLLDFKILRNLIFYHIGLTLAYYIYALYKPSDSYLYFEHTVSGFRGPTWGDFYGISTVFVEFWGYPFVNYLGMNFETIMMVFSWFGLMGFYFMYAFLRENIQFNHKVFGYDLLTVILFLPNLHFWSASFGKGAIIFFGIALYFYSLNKIGTRLLAFIVGSVIIYHVRPHVLFIILLGTAVSAVFSFKGVGWFARFFVLVVAVGVVIYIYNDVLSLTGIKENELFEESTTLSKRARDLNQGSSGVDISGYNFPMKLFTFLFRPLFVDAPGMLGIIVSFENLFYLYIFSKLASWSFIPYLITSDFKIKTALISFLGVSFALAQLASNLGLAMRQKSQVMILMMFVIMRFLDERRAAELRDSMARRRHREAMIKKREELLRA